MDSESSTAHIVIPHDILLRLNHKIRRLCEAEGDHIDGDFQYLASALQVAAGTAKHDLPHIDSLDSGAISREPEDGCVAPQQPSLQIPTAWPRGVKRNSDNRDSSPSDVQAAAPATAPMRAAWDCKRAGNRKEAARIVPEVQTFGGQPMVHGPDGLEPDPRLLEECGCELCVGDGGRSVEEADQNGANPGQGCSAGDDGESEVDKDDGDGMPPKKKQKCKGKVRGKGKGKETWEVVAETRFQKEAAPLMATLSLMSSVRHQDGLLELILALCPKSQPISTVSTVSSASSSTVAGFVPPPDIYSTPRDILLSLVNRHVSCSPVLSDTFIYECFT
jgi:hypothetical protein